MSEKMSEKNIIFDLDHTLGFFEQLIHMMQHCDLSCHELLDLFPELFRPLFLDFLLSLVQYKQSGKIKSVIMYSNNSHDLFVNTIISYIHSKINYPLFDKIITMGHPLRKKKQKEYLELLELSEGILTIESILCFIDDKMHPLMNKKQVQYILCEGYTVFVKHKKVIELTQRSMPEYRSKKRCLNKFNQIQVSNSLIHRIRFFILR
jgi:hypothetical protein